MISFKEYITEAKSEQIIVYRLGSKQDNLFGKNDDDDDEIDEEEDRKSVV